MLDGYCLLTCPACNAKMKYRGSRTQVECKKCNTPIPVPVTNLSNSQAAPITQSYGVVSHASVQAVTPAIPSQPNAQESFEPTGIPIAAELLLGILLGVVAFVLISYFKADISRFGLVLIVSATLLALSIQYYVLHVIVRRPVTPHATRRILGVPLAMFLCVFGFLTVFEVCIPNRDGICRKMIEGERPMTDDEMKVAQSNEAAKRVLEQASAEAKKHELLTKAKAEKESQWNQADCLLINPGHKIVGLRIKNARNSPEFRVVAKTDDVADGGVSARAIMKEFWNTRIPIIAHDASLARRVHSDVSENNLVAEEHFEQLRRVWLPICFIPESKPIMYVEAAGGRKRFGYRFDQGENGFAFCELVPRRKYSIFQSPGNEVPPFQGFMIDSIDKSKHLKAGSDVQELLDHELRREADLLDYCVMDMLRRLQTHQNHATSLYDMRAPSLYVDDVELDASYADQSLAELRGVAENLSDDMKKEVQNALSNFQTSGDPVNAILTTLMKVAADRKSEDTRNNVSKTLRSKRDADLEIVRQQIGKLQRLIELKKGLTSEIRSRLVNTQITLVERSARFTHLASVEAIKRQRNKTDQMVGISFMDAMEAGMLDATHVVMATVRAPKATGHYELSMRLVDTRTGVILWEVQGDRVVPGVVENQAASSKPAPPKDLSGQWRDPIFHNRFEIKDDGENLNVRLFQSNTVSEFELRGHHDKDAIKVDSCFITFKTGSGKRHTIEATFKRISNSKCELRYETVNVNSYGAIYRGSKETTILERE
jgi:hypothetical protein